MTTKITFDVGNVQALDRNIRAVTAERIGRSNLVAVNEVTLRAYDLSRKTMIRGINLPDTYLRERMAVIPASDAGKPQAIIRASYRHTLLSRYGARQLVRSAPGAKGSPSRGIAPGTVNAGVSVEVTRGNRKGISNVFLIPLKNGNGLGVFVREGGRLRILYAPSVYQLFRASLDINSQAILDDLEATAMAGVQKIMETL